MNKVCSTDDAHTAVQCLLDVQGYLVYHGVFEKLFGVRARRVREKHEAHRRSRDRRTARKELHLSTSHAARVEPYVLK